MDKKVKNKNPNKKKIKKEKIKKKKKKKIPRRDEIQRYINALRTTADLKKDPNYNQIIQFNKTGKYSKKQTEYKPYEFENTNLIRKENRTSNNPLDDTYIFLADEKAMKQATMKFDLENYYDSKLKKRNGIYYREEIKRFSLNPDPLYNRLLDKNVIKPFIKISKMKRKRLRNLKLNEVSNNFRHLYSRYKYKYDLKKLREAKYEDDETNKLNEKLERSRQKSFYDSVNKFFNNDNEKRNVKQKEDEEEEFIDKSGKTIRVKPVKRKRYIFEGISLGGKDKFGNLRTMRQYLTKKEKKKEKNDFDDFNF